MSNQEMNWFNGQHLRKPVSFLDGFALQMLKEIDPGLIGDGNIATSRPVQGHYFLLHEPQAAYKRKKRSKLLQNKYLRNFLTLFRNKSLSSLDTFRKANIMLISHFRKVFRCL